MSGKACFVRSPGRIGISVLFSIFMQHEGFEKRLYNKSMAPPAVAVTSDGSSTASHAYDPNLPQQDKAEQSQSRDSSRVRDQCRDIRPPGLRPLTPGLLRQTNPISGRTEGRITADKERSYDE